MKKSFEEIIKEVKPNGPGYAYDVPQFLYDLFNNELYKADTLQNERSEEPRSYDSNEILWEDILCNNLNISKEVTLENFCVLEWLPMSPGRYFTREAASCRETADLFVNEYKDEYLPMGKVNMIEGGVGSVRLKPYDNTYYLCASSSGVSHQGIPLALSRELYGKCIDQIKEFGCVFADITGVVDILQQEKSIIEYDLGVPKYVINVDTIKFRTQREKDILVTIAALYYEKDSVEKELYSYKGFFPDKKDDNLTAAVAWIEEYALRHAKYRPVSFFADFDEHKRHFELPVDFYISDVMAHKINITALKKIASRHGITLNFINMGDNISNVGGSVFKNVHGSISSSGNVEIKGSFNQRYGEDVAKILQSVGEIVDKSEDASAKGLFELFKKELESEKPEKSTLQTLWDGLLKMLPAVKPVADIFSLLPF